MMRIVMVFEGEEAEETAKALEPDNLPGMEVSVSVGRFEVSFSAEKLGTLLATADDLLMNIKIAEDALKE